MEFRGRGNKPLDGSVHGGVNHVIGAILRRVNAEGDGDGDGDVVKRMVLIR